MKYENEKQYYKTFTLETIISPELATKSTTSTRTRIKDY